MEYRNKELYGDFYENENKPLIVIIGGSVAGIPTISYGLLEYLKSNYNVLVLAYHGIGDLPKNLERIPLEYFIHAINYFKNKLNLMDNDITVIGSSKGGELVLLLISEYYIHPHIAIVCVPSCYVWQGIPKNMLSILFPKSCWTFDNKDVPFVKYRYSKKIIKDIKNQEYSSCHEKSIRKNKNTNAIIKINNFKGKLLLLSAEVDHFWPSKEMCNFIEKNSNSNIKHVVLNLEGHYFLEYEESGKEIIAFLNQHKSSFGS
jgi:esterase/lipase